MIQVAIKVTACSSREELVNSIRHPTTDLSIWAATTVSELKEFITNRIKRFPDEKWLIVRGDITAQYKDGDVVFI